MNKLQRIISLLLIDTVLIGLSVYAAYLLRFDFKILPQYIPTLPIVAALFMVLTLGCLAYFKIYKRVWQYASIGDLISIFKGVLAGSVLFLALYMIVLQTFWPSFIIPRSIFVITGMLMLFLIGGSRFLWRMFRDNYIRIQPHHRKALIIGAGDAGTVVVKELKHSYSELYPVAYIDDNIQKKGMEILGVPVVGDRSQIPEIVERLDIQDIIIAIPSASRAQIAEVISICKETGCHVKIIPKVNDLLNGKVSIDTIRDVQVEDLLGRDPVKVDLAEISDYLQGEVVLVTGAGGSIGSELCRQVAGFSPKKLLLLGRGENSIYEIEIELRKSFPKLAIEPIIADIQHEQRMLSVFETHQPSVVFHAAAHKHVPLMEKNPIEAVKNNILGTRNVAECAHRCKVDRFVMISTDKAVNPTSVMGASKRIAEMIVQGYNQKSDTRFTAVRFGNVLGSRGSVIPLFKRQIKEGGPVTVTHPEMIRYFMTIPEAVQLVIQAGALTEGGEIYILDMGQPVKIADLAKDLILLSGLELKKDIEIRFTGIRPGEKLFEELLTNEEGTQATKHDRIYIGKAEEVKAAKVEMILRSFEHLANQQADALPVQVKQELKRWLPNFLNEQHPDRTKNELLKPSLEIVASLQSKSR